MPEARLTVRNDGVNQAADSLARMAEKMKANAVAARQARTEAIAYERAMHGVAAAQALSARAQVAAVAVSATLAGRRAQEMAVFQRQLLASHVLAGRGGGQITMASAQASLLNMKTLMVGAATYMAGSFVLNSIKVADQSERAERAYKKMGGTAEGLKALQEATGYRIGKSELAYAGAQAFRANPKLTEAQFGTMTRFAGVMAEEGMDFKTVLSETNDALIRFRYASLKRLGLQLDENKVLDDGAHTLGKHRAQLSRAEHDTFLLTAALAAMEKYSQGAASGTDNATKALRQTAIVWQEFQEAFGAWAAKWLLPALQGLNALIGEGPVVEPADKSARLEWLAAKKKYRTGTPEEREAMRQVFAFEAERQGPHGLGSGPPPSAPNYVPPGAPRKGKPTVLNIRPPSGDPRG